MKFKFLFLLLLIPIVLLSDVIRFGLHWQPQAQFAGYIMAVEKDFFAEESLEVKLVFTEGVDLILDKLKNYEFEYATAWLSQAIYSNEAEELVNLTQILQQSSLMIVGKKKNGIKKISDLNNKNVSLWNGDFTMPLQAFLTKHNLTINKLPGKANIDLFMSEACDAASVMYYNEYNKIYLAGVDFDDLIAFKFSEDNDLNFIEDGVYVRKDYYRNHQDEAVKMRNAILKGWIYAYHNREETVQTVLKYCNEKKLRTNYAEQKWMLDKILEALLPKVSWQNDNFYTEVGILNQNDYLHTAQELKKQGKITKIIPFENFYSGLKND